MQRHVKIDQSDSGELLVTLIQANPYRQADFIVQEVGEAYERIGRFFETGDVMPEMSAGEFGLTDSWDKVQ